MSLANKRGGHRASVARYIKAVDDVLSSSPINEAMLESLKIKLEDQRKTLQKLDKSIQDELVGDEEVKDIGSCDDIDLNITICVVKIDRHFRQVQSVPNPTQSSAFVEAKLPVLPLSKFSGDVVDWPSFEDEFKAVVGNRVDLTDSRKLCYLKGQLTGNALKLISGYMITNDNYFLVWDLLKRTYGCPDRIVIQHLNFLLDLKSPSMDVKSLSDFRAQFECHLRGLEAMNKDIKVSGYIFANLLLRKLPSKIQENLNRINSSMLWKLDSLRDELRKEIDLLNNVESKSQNRTSSSESPLSNFALSQKNGAKSYRNCQLCEQPHAAYKCDKYPTPQLRFNRARELNVCINCLGKSHRVNKCRSLKKCFTCKKKHHSALCFGFQSDEEKQPEKEEKPNSSLKTAINSVFYSRKSVSLPIANVSVLNAADEFCSVTAIIDQCAQASIILRRASDNLQLTSIAEEIIELKPFDGKAITKKLPIVRVPIQVNNKTWSVKAFVVEEMSEAVTIPGLSKIVDILRHRNVNLTSAVGSFDVIKNIEMLIGADYYYQFVKGLRIVNGVHLLQTVFGELISGPLPVLNNICDNFSQNSFTLLRLDAKPTDSSSQIDYLWNLDSIGLAGSVDLDKDPVMQRFEESIRYEDGRYIVRLPWKEKHPSLPSNYGLARSRLSSTLRKLKTNKDHLKEYIRVIVDQEKRGFIEEVPESEHRTSMVHYLPHQAVVKESATTPIRVVYDCSAASKNSNSLNDCLYSGPSLIQDLSKIILRFRLYEFASVSDISKAFLMVGLHRQDRDYTRFLWPRDPSNEESSLRIYRFCVVLFGATCSQFLLNSTILHHLRRIETKMGNMIARNLYIDNLQLNASTEEELLTNYREVKKIMSEAGMSLREWSSNSKRLEALCQSEGDISCVTGNESKVLGIYWNKVSDTFRIAIPTLTENARCTKRIILSISAAIFDPHGWLSPLSVRARLLLQDLWKKKLDWDDAVTDEVSDEWEDILKDFHSSARIILPRCIIKNLNAKVNIHAFADASEKAYGACIYFLINEESYFIMAKAKVAPVSSPMTIPKLELSAAVVATRLVKHVIEAYNSELNFDKTYLWSDSQIVLAWLNSSKELTPYVLRRVAEIKENLPNSSSKYNYVTSKENPADIISRGASFQTLTQDSFWFSGPTCLMACADKHVFSTCKSEDSVSEELSVAMVTKRHQQHFIMDFVRVGSYDKLLRIVAYVFLFFEKIRNSSPDKDANLNIRLLENAEKFVLQNTQIMYMGEEYDLLKNPNMTNSSNIIKQLRLFLDEDNIIRLSGRLNNSDLDFSAKYPILLPYDSPVTKLIIEKYHAKKHHFGVEYLVASIRQRFWIPKMRQRIKMVIRSCIICKKLQGLKYHIPIPGQLPKCRVQQDRPFQITGVDYTGHLMVRNGRETKKVYVALFTCGLTRAIHLELVEDNAAETFVRAFRRFVGRRAIPRIVYSDNATTFLASAEHLRNIREHPSIQKLSLDMKFEWRTIPARAAWYGGFWERLVGLTKMSLRKTLGRSLVSMDEIRTILVEIEASLNDRPLTYSSDNPLDLDAITPSKLIYGYRVTEYPTPIQELDEDFSLNGSILSARQKKREKLNEHFWQRWKKEYLTSLRERHIQQAKRGQQSNKNVQKGDVVLIEDDLRPRIHWRLGLVEELVQGSDNEVRSVTLRTSSGMTHRPVAKLYPIEVEHNNDDPNHDSREQFNVASPKSKRTQRIAAVVARDKIKNQLQDVNE